MIGIWVPCRQRTSQIINCAFKATMLTIFTSHSGIHFAATLVKVCPRLPRRTENRRAMSFSSIREEREIFCRARLQVLSCSDRPELRIHLAANYTPAGGGEEGSFLKPLTPSLLGLDASELFENNANSSVFCQRTIIFFPSHCSHVSVKTWKLKLISVGISLQVANPVLDKKDTEFQTWQIRKDELGRR